MSVRPLLLALGAALCLGAWSPLGAQTVYKCGYRTYSEKPCSPGRIVNTDDAPVPPRNAELRRAEQSRILARSLRQKPGESAAEFETRRRRTRLIASDREECARLDTRIPVEKARMNNPDKDEVLEAQASLQGAQKRFRELRC